MLEDRRAAPDAAPPAAVTRSFSVYRDPVTWAIALAVCGAYATLSLYRLLSLTPGSWDLGIYTEYVKQYADLRAPVVDIRGPGFNLLGDHFQVIVALLAPFFRVFPSPATLLVAQAVLTAASVFAVAAAGAALLGRGTGRAVAAAYGFSWGLQQMIDFDFHEIAFAVPMLAFSLSALIRGKPRAAVWWALPLVFVKEDQGFTVAAIGALMLLTAARGSARFGAGMRGGWLLLAWGLAWSVIEIGVIIPHFNPLHTYYYWKDGGVVGSGHFSATGLLAQPLRGYAEKLQTVVLLLLPTAFTALGSPVALIALPSVALRFISTNSSYWGTDWHYNATVMPVLFLAGLDAMARWRAASAVSRGPARRWRAALRAAGERHGAAMMLAVAAAMAFQFPLSGLWHGQTYEIGAQVAADNAAMAVVPDGATVTTTLDLLAPLAARTDTFWIGSSDGRATRYIVFDANNSGYSPPPGNAAQFIAQMYPSAKYEQVFDRDGVYVFRRG